MRDDASRDLESPERRNEPVTNQQLATDGGQDVIEIDRTDAETLLEAAGTLRDDLASGRQWGWDGNESRENARELENAHRALQEELREASGDGDRTVATDGGQSRHQCDLCGTAHETVGAALRCCADQFDDRPLVADGGASPGDRFEATQQTNALRRLADAAERQARVLEDQNALLYELCREVHLGTRSERELDQEPVHARKPDVEDALAALNYTQTFGGRSDGRPEEDE